MYVVSAASASVATRQTAKTSKRYFFISPPLGAISSEINRFVSDGIVDDAGFNQSYGACKLLDYLGYGAFIGTGNQKKAEITKTYLGTAYSADGQNPLIYGTTMMVTCYRYCLIRRFTLIFIVILNGKSTWLMLIT